MRCRNRIRVWALIGAMVILQLVLIVAGSAAAVLDLNRSLTGDFAFTEIVVCVSSKVPNSDGIDNTTFQLLEDATTNTSTVQGIIRFNGDGTGSIVSFRSVVINHSTTADGDRPVSQTEGTCDLTYTVSPDNSFVQSHVCAGTVLAGSGVGNTFTLTNAEFEGQIIPGGKSFVFHTTIPNVETLTINPLIPGPFFERVCGRSGTAMKIR